MFGLKHKKLMKELEYLRGLLPTYEGDHEWRSTVVGRILIRMHRLTFPDWVDYDLKRWVRRLCRVRSKHILKKL